MSSYLKDDSLKKSQILKEFANSVQGHTGCLLPKKDDKTKKKEKKNLVVTKMKVDCISGAFQDILCHDFILFFLNIVF